MTDHGAQCTVFRVSLQIIRRCGASRGEPICVKTFMEVLGSSHVQFEPKELARLERITNEVGLIETEEFMDYAKRSAAVKEFSLRGSRGGGSKHDKAELAFKVRIFWNICIWL